MSARDLHILAVPDRPARLLSGNIGFVYEDVEEEDDHFSGKITACLMTSQVDILHQPYAWYSAELFGPPLSTFAVPR